MKKINSILTLVFSLLIISASHLGFSSYAEPAYEAFDGAVKVRLCVYVLDIDPHQKLATVKVRVFVDYFPYNLTQVRVLISGGGWLEVYCNNVVPHRKENWWYQGESNQTIWLLEGRGENFPFDSYILHFKINGISSSYPVNNFSLNHQQVYASFTGSKRYSLIDQWQGSTFIPVMYIQNDEVCFTIQRTLNSMVISIFQFLLPIILCYYLLGSTLIMNPKEKIVERLTINLSLFVFSATFLISIQGFLPYRSSQSLPELLLSNLMVSNAIFGIFSIIENQCKGNEKKTESWDFAATLFSLFFFLISYQLTLFGKINPLTSLFLAYGVIPSYVYGFVFKTTLPRRKILEWFLSKKYLTIPLIILILLPACLWFLTVVVPFFNRYSSVTSQVFRS